MMRMTLNLQKVLYEFLNNPKVGRYGLDLCRSSGLVSGTLYPILRRLEAEGWVEGMWEDIDEKDEGRRKRRYYVLTEKGAVEGREQYRNSLLERLAPLDAQGGGDDELQEDSRPPNSDLVTNTSGIVGG